jgi:hypothetical protein
MQPDYEIDVGKRLVFVRFAKRLTARDIEGYVAGLRKDPYFDPAFAEIVDLRAVEEIDLTPAQAIELADAVDPFSMSTRRAFVTVNDSQTNAARMHQILRRPAKTIAIFDSMSKAEEWVRSAVSRSSSPGGRVLAFPSHFCP